LKIVRITLACALVALLLSWPSSLCVQAAAGSLDGSFGKQGTTSTDFSGNDDEARSIAIQEDGKIVVAGITFNLALNAGDFAIARYDREGSLDSTFGSRGKAVTDFGYDDSLLDIALQPDGKIVAAGAASNPSAYASDFALARYNTDGSLDPTFGVGGKVVTDFSNQVDRGYAVGLQSNGKIVVAGTTSREFAGGQHFALVRYNVDGSLDTSFGSNGKVVTVFYRSESGGESVDLALDLAIDSQDRIVVAGSSGKPLTGFGDTGYDFALARYNSDGSPDLTFGSEGRVTTDWGSRDDAANAVLIQPDGNIIVGGYAFQSPETTSKFALARFGDSGDLDPSFGSGGRVSNDSSQMRESIQSLALQPDGRIVAAGFIFSSDGSSGITTDFAVARYSKDGGLDPSFADGGRITNDISTQDSGWAVAIQNDGKIVVAGSTLKQTRDFAVLRYEGETRTPQIGSVSVRGKKLFVEGVNFVEGAQLFLNEAKQKKVVVNSSTEIVSKKAGNNVVAGQNRVQIVNPDGGTSNEYTFTFTP